MKLDNVTQWVRSVGAPQVPPAQSLASRAVANPTCIVGNGGCGAGGSKGTGCVTEPRNLYTRGLLGYSASSRRKPTTCNYRKAAVSGAVRQASATPPGSAIADMACAHRGSSETWEIQYFPSRDSRCEGGLAQQTSKAWMDVTASSIRESARRHETNAMQGYPGSSESVEPGDGILEVLAKHSTESELL